MKRDILAALLLAVTLAGCAAPAAATPAPVNAPEGVVDLSAQAAAMRPGYEQDVEALGDNRYYWLDLSATLSDTLTVDGVQRVRYRNTGSVPLDSVVFRLYANAVYGRPVLAVDAVEVAGAPADFATGVGESLLLVTLPAALAPGDAVDVTMRWALTLAGGDSDTYGALSYVDGIGILASFVPLLSVVEDGAWWGGPIHNASGPTYTEMALFDVTLRTPEDVQVVGTGQELSAETAEGITTRHLVSGPAREFAVVLGRDIELVSGPADDVTINIWSLPGDALADNYALDLSTRAVKTYDSLFGAYPLAELDVIELPVLGQALEYPGIVYVDTDNWEDDSFVLRVALAHGLSHQWWYNVIGSNQVDAPWLDESLAEYSIALFFGEEFGVEAKSMVRQRFEADLSGYFTEGYELKAIGLPANEYTAYEYVVHAHSTGALFYMWLSDRYGEERTTSFLKTYYQNYRYQNVDNEALGRLIAAFFDEEAAAAYSRVVLGD